MRMVVIVSLVLNVVQEYVLIAYVFQIALKSIILLLSLILASVLSVQNALPPSAHQTIAPRIVLLMKLWETTLMDAIVLMIMSVLLNFVLKMCVNHLVVKLTHMGSIMITVIVHMTMNVSQSCVTSLNVNPVVSIPRL
jgi:hypothetical protein